MNLFLHHVDGLVCVYELHGEEIAPGRSVKRKQLNKTGVMVLAFMWMLLWHIPPT